MTTTPSPIICDLTSATDTLEERQAEYIKVFDSLVGRERTSEGIRFRFNFDSDLEVRIRDLADRETSCCSFFTFTIDRHGNELWWDSSVVDDDIARQVLDDYYDLPLIVHDGIAELTKRFSTSGLRITTKE